MVSIHRPCFLVLAACLVVLGAGCRDHHDQKAPKPRSADAAPTRSDVPDSFLLSSKPDGAKAAAEIRRTAKTGDDVVVVGRVGGSEVPFVDGAAVFTIIDPILKDCATEGPMGDCKTPWDYCCTDPKELAANTVTVELDKDDKPLRTSARGFHGLDHSRTVVVRGKARKDDAGNMTVIASGLWVQP